MAVEKLVRRLSGAVKNAVVWGAAWFGLTVATFAALRVAGVDVGSAGSLWPLDAIFIGMRVGVIGGIAGGAFSVFISLFYRGRRLSEISWVRFGVGGGIVAGLFVPAFMVMGNLLSGDGLPSLSAIDTDAMLATLFGAVTAGASMWLAQRAEAPPGGSENELDLLEGGDPLASMGAKDGRDRERQASGGNR